MRSAVKWPSSSSGALACATTCSSSSSAGRYSISSVTSGRIGKACAFCFLSSLIAGARERLAGLEDDVAALGHDVRPGLVPGQAGVVVADGPLDLAVRRLDEAVAVDPAVGRERADQADVRAFRRLDRADAAVVAVVDVADVEAGALARQAARAEGREAALAGQLGQRVGLVHELGELAAAEELLHRRHDGPDVDQRVRASPCPAPGSSCARGRRAPCAAGRCGTRSGSARRWRGCGGCRGGRCRPWGGARGCTR